MRNGPFQSRRIAFLAKCDLLRHLPAREIGEILPCIRDRQVSADTILFRAGDPGGALYIVARGKMAVLLDAALSGEPIAVLGEGHAFGEMALLSSGPCTATMRAVEDSELLKSARRISTGW